MSALGSVSNRTETQCLDEAPHAAPVPGAAPPKPPSGNSTSVWNAGPAERSEPQPSSSSCGAVSAEALARGLTKEEVSTQVRNLLSSSLSEGLEVSDGDARAALGLIDSLPRSERKEVLAQMAHDGSLAVLARQLPDDARGQFVGTLVDGGLTSETAARRAPQRQPQPPDQPALVRNEPGLPPDVRTLIHAENRARAAEYTHQFKAYVQDYCAAVKNAQTPQELRALGPLSTPPSLSEPGVLEAEQKRFGWKTALTQTSVGIEEASLAVSNRVSDFRHEIHAGEFALTLDGTLKFTTEVAKKGEAGLELSRSLELTNDGRLLENDLEVKNVFKLHDVEIAADRRGVEAVKLELGDSELELNREGKLSLKAEVGGVRVGSEVDPNAAQYGARVGLGHEFKIGKAGTLEAEVMAGVKFQGVAREYYADIGGTQPGIFGPMPELDAKVAWSAMPKDRQDWYARQGFTREFWEK